MKRVTSVYTFSTEEPVALAAAFEEAGHLVADRGYAAVSIRLPSDDDVAREVAATVGHTGTIATGLGMHRRTLTP